MPLRILPYYADLPLVWWIQMCMTLCTPWITPEASHPGNLTLFANDTMGGDSGEDIPAHLGWLLCCMFTFDGLSLWRFRLYNVWIILFEREPKKIHQDERPDPSQRPKGVVYGEDRNPRNEWYEWLVKLLKKLLKGVQV